MMLLALVEKVCYDATRHLVYFVYRTVKVRRRVQIVLNFSLIKTAFFECVGFFVRRALPQE